MFGRLVRSHRQRLGLTQQELADRAKLGARTIRNLEAGLIRSPRPVTVRLLADAFGLTGQARDRFCEAAAGASSAPAQLGELGEQAVGAAVVQAAVRIAPAAALPRLGVVSAVVPAQLPPGISGFVGRRAEQALLDAVLVVDASGAARMVVVSGMPGVGKSALAVHWAHRVSARFPDGQLYIDLRGFDPAGSVVSTAAAIRAFLDAFSVAPARIPAETQAQIGLYRSVLAAKRVLLVLDNARDTEHVRALLPGSPTSAVVVTSRNRLTGLIAGAGAATLTLDVVSAAEANDLLGRRLGADRVTTEQAAVQEIIDRCGRLPLALSIIAARAATQAGVPLAALAEELRHGSKLESLADEDPATDARTVFSCSYHALSPPTARLFRLLSVHPGGHLRTTAVASIAGGSMRTTGAALAELTRANLLTRPAVDRYACHDLLRAHASELSHANDSDAERRAAWRRLLDHYLNTAWSAALLLEHRDPIAVPAAVTGTVREDLDGPEQAMAWFTAEHRTLVTLIHQAEEAGLDRYVWQLAWTLDDFFDRRGQWHDFLAIQASALAAAGRLADPSAQAKTHRSLARAYTMLGDLQRAQAHLSRALDLCVEMGDSAGEAHTLGNLAFVFDRQGRHREALDHDERALALYRATGYRLGQARALNAIGWYHAQLGDLDSAVRYCQQALDEHRELADWRGEAATLGSLGYANHRLGNTHDAIVSYEQALKLYRDNGDRYAEADTLGLLGDTQHTAGKLDAARQNWQQALHLLEQLDHDDADKARARLSQLHDPVAPDTGSCR
jgi:tetratricopeptide (TPR) repeat protein/transcriptional regulator with XRE-family HTH domain